MTAAVRASWTSALLRCYRLGMLVLIAWLVREHCVWLRVGVGNPITAAEAAEFFPEAVSLQSDGSDRLGSHVLDAHGRRIGYVVRTMPMCGNIIGYTGTTDTLIAFDPDLKVVGVKIRSSEDNKTHVEDIIYDRQFMSTWNGMSWNEVAAMDLEKAGIEGVSGATQTSLAIAESIIQRLRQANEQLARRAPLRLRVRDAGLALVIVAAALMAFTHLHGRRWMRRLFQALVIGYVGFVNGDLIAQALLAGWMKQGVPWTLAPGMALLVAAALVVPWVTRKPFYCQHLCPFGAAQEWAGRVAPHKLRLHLPHSLAAGLRWLPPLLLAFVIVVIMLALPVDLTGIEPFDAFVIRAAGTATIAVAIVGLIAAMFVPMAYCKYGCPTGALLEFVRSRGAQDRFGRRDVAVLLMAVLVLVLHWKYTAIYAWILGSS